MRWLKTVIAGIGSLVAGGFTMDAVGRSGRYYEETSAAVALLVAIAIMIPISARIWKRPALDVAAYGFGLASFYCLWTAAGSGALHPFTKEQWILLGVTLLTAAGVAWRTQRRSRT